MKTINIKNKTSIQKIKQIGRQMAVRKQLKGLGVKVLDKEDVLREWGQVRKDYESR